jgi:hypothetical protein
LIIDNLPILSERIIPLPQDSRVKVFFNSAEFKIQWAILPTVPVTRKGVMCSNDVETVEKHGEKV